MNIYKKIRLFTEKCLFQSFNFQKIFNNKQVKYIQQQFNRLHIVDSSKLYKQSTSQIYCTLQQTAVLHLVDSSKL